MADYFEIAERHPHPKYGPPKVIGDAASQSRQTRIRFTSVTPDLQAWIQKAGA